MTKRLLLAACLVATSACEAATPPASSFYDERISPIVEVGCVQQTTGCHRASDLGEAVGNLDLSSYDALARRHDVLPAYGPYSRGLLLLKAGEPIQIPVETFSPDPITGEYFTLITTDVRHAGGAGVALSSSGFAALKQWIESGAARTGAPVEALASSMGGCVHGVGSARGFDPAVAPPDATSYEAFVRDVQPVLRETCAGSRCHGSPIADLFLSCGETEEELRWNYFAALSHVAEPASTSDLLRRPLSTLRGGSFHEGGNILPSTEDPRYQALFAWANELVTRDPSLVHPSGPIDPGLAFFADRVQPVLVRKGCMFLNCHSPAMFHDLRLRAGSQGAFSRIATERNYEFSRLMLSIESADPNDSRIIAKNLFLPQEVAGGRGLAHRGGSLFEDFGTPAAPNPATLDDCDGVDADAGDLNTLPAYCVLARWHAIEREQAVLRGELEAAPVRSLAWITRPDGVGEIRDFDTFRGGADLRVAPLTVEAGGGLTLGGDTSLLASCPVGAGADVRTPAVSWDAQRIAFAARATAADPLRLYWVHPDGTGCELVPGIDAGVAEQNGILVHDFDPAFAPDGRLVFASTRGPVGVSMPYTGPTRTPAALQPNANLYVRDADGTIRELTFLLNQELAPTFMTDGRLIFTAEKREPEFHQLALRRQNLDGGDYHPLFAQRKSIGYERATEVIELANRDFAFIGAPDGAVDGAGTLVVLNRSIGPDQDDRPAGDRAYIHSMSVPVPGASVEGGKGAFRSPATVPSGRIVLSCDLAAASLTAGPFHWDLCQLDTVTGALAALGGAADRSDVEAVAVYPRVSHGVFRSRIDEVNGHTAVFPGEERAEIHVHDFPLLATLLFANTREGRPIDPDVGGFNVYEALPPPASATSFAELGDKVVTDGYGQVYVDYHRLGFVPTHADGSARFSVPGGAPILLEATDRDGRVLHFDGDPNFTGPMRQREQMQFYPGEHANQSLRRTFFDGLCGGCHGSVTGRELNIAVDVDVLTSASRTQSYDDAPLELFR
jgi:hypothetical protein